MVRRISHSECLLRLVAIGSVLVVGVCSAAEDDSRPEDFEVVVSGVSGVEPLTSGLCSIAQVSFAGKLLAKRSDHKRYPVEDAQYVAVGPWGLERRGRVPTMQDGSFEIELEAWHHGSGPGPIHVTISAPGCKDLRLKVKKRWRPKTMVLKCASG